MKSFFTLIFSFAAFTLFAQLPPADSISTAKGNLTIQPVFHAALVLQWNGKTIYVDPYNGAGAYEGLKKPDLILITDIHGDHLDMKTLNGIDTKSATFVVPQAVAEKLPAEWKSRIIGLANGTGTTQAGINIKALPMYNLPNDSTARHPKGRGNGYLLSLGGKQVYISGDTEDIPEMRKLKNIDIAFVCMNIPYTMTVEQAASAVLEFKPAVVYPYHYRNAEGFSDTQKFKQLVNAGDQSIDVRLRDWYASGK